MPRLLAIAAALGLAACASTPTPPPAAKPTPPKPSAQPSAPAPAGPVFTLTAAQFTDLPGWAEADHAPALAAFRRSCAAMARRADDQPLGRLAPYGGTVGDWRSACAAAQTAADPRAFFEAAFTPMAVNARADQMRRLTGYYEPVVAARRTPDATFSEPFLPRPADLVGIDLSLFDERQGLSENTAEDVVKGLPNEITPAQKALIEAAIDERLERRWRTPIWGRLTANRTVAPYPPRADIDLAASPLAFARACDVYDIQVQGSARVRFEDGQEARIAYAAQNGWRWSSIYPQLRDRGAIQAGQMNRRGVCAWMAGQSPPAVREAMNLDPSYVFFSLEPIGDPTAGPRGAQGAALTALGSMAVDPAAHPYGALIYVDGQGPNAAGGQGPFRRLMVAQDTGGAIRRGPLRGDVFFGTGDGAGALAERMNAPASFWTLLPNTLAGKASLVAALAAPRGAE